MKIGLLIQRFPHGGAEQYVKEIAQRLQRKNDEVVVITSKNRNSDDSKYGFRIIRLETRFKIGEYSFWKGLEGVLQNEHFDIIHTNSYGYYHSDKSARLKKKLNYKLVITSHGFHGVEINRLRKNNLAVRTTPFTRLRPLYDNYVGFSTLRCADHLIALSRRDVEFYKEARISDDKITIIPPGVKNLFFSEQYDKELRSRLGDGPLLISVGELSLIKSQAVQIRAMPLIIKEKPNAKLFLIGKDRTELENLKSLCHRLGVDKNVFFLGFQDDVSLFSYLCSCDLLLHTSLAEGLSTILIEAMSCGLPFVTTAAGGNGYLADESGAGVVVPFEDEKALASTVVSLINNRKRLELMHVNGKKFSAQFRWDKVFERIYKIYTDLSKTSLS
jgi:glycosyltransferase involved in cell wall biosynthesis